MDYLLAQIRRIWNLSYFWDLTCMMNKRGMLPNVLLNKVTPCYTNGTLVIVGMLSVLLAACSSTGSVRGTAGHVSVRRGGDLVTGRSLKPTEINAPGIQIPESGRFSFSIGHYEVVINGSNWDTIAGASHVTNLVGVEFSLGFNHTGATDNRFQYLADEISLHYAGANFEPLTIVEGVANGQLIDIAALYNPASQVKRLLGLKVTISSKPSGAIVASQTFFATSGAAIIFPAHTVYFVRLAFSRFNGLGRAKGGMRHFVTNFYYSKFTTCRNQICD